MHQHTEIVGVDALGELIARKIVRKILLAIVAFAMIGFYVHIVLDVLNDEPEQPNLIPFPQKGHGA